MMKPQDFLLIAIPAAQKAQAASGIPASITVAQAALESGWGEHIPPGSYNYFGIKAVPGQPSVVSITTEYIKGVLQHVEQAFAKYDSMADSFAAHTKLISTSHIYRAAMDVKGNAQKFAEALQACGYSTSPYYAKALMQLVVSHDLTKYDVTATPPGTETRT